MFCPCHEVVKLPVNNTKSMEKLEHTTSGTMQVRSQSHPHVPGESLVQSPGTLLTRSALFS